MADFVWLTDEGKAMVMVVSFNPLEHRRDHPIPTERLCLKLLSKLHAPLNPKYYPPNLQILIKFKGRGTINTGD